MKRLIVLFLLLTVVLNCERDDICAESTTTTPLLIIRFYDTDETDTTKNVRQLTVRAEGTETDWIETTTTDSIAIPLKVVDEGSDPTTIRYRFIKDADYALDQEDEDEENEDIIDITYTTEFVYVSRACGYKSIFELQGSQAITVEPDGNNWINFIEIDNANITNENAAQVRIRH